MMRIYTWVKGTRSGRLVVAACALTMFAVSVEGFKSDAHAVHPARGVSSAVGRAQAAKSPIVLGDLTGKIQAPPSPSDGGACMGFPGVVGTKSFNDFLVCSYNANFISTVERGLGKVGNIPGADLEASLSNAMWNSGSTDLSGSFNNFPYSTSGFGTIYYTAVRKVSWDTGYSDLFFYRGYNLQLMQLGGIIGK